VPHGIVVGPYGEKMSKSRGNVVNPNDIVETYGADTLRMYELFLGPHEQMVAWNDKGIIGVRRFIERVWKLYQENNVAPNVGEESRQTTTHALEKILHQTIKKITDDIETFRFNTAISALMICANGFADHTHSGGTLSQKQKEAFALLLAPFAPHLAEELWQKLGHTSSLAREPWPTYDESLIAEDTFILAVQISGKTRDTIECPVGISEEDAFKNALERPNVKKWTNGQKIQKTIYIKDRLINIVIS
ncbi:MAG: class I tRNA ligase family protein, partial [Patescibacteria group bacterium]